jgi:hypothetical protein
MAATDTHATIEKSLEAVFYVGSVPMLNNEDQLPSEDRNITLTLEEILETAARTVGILCETAASLGISQWSELVGELEGCCNSVLLCYLHTSPNILRATSSGDV